MATINQKLTTLMQALETLHEGIVLFHEYEKTFSTHASQRNEQLFMGMRDSMIQRFEYCTDLFWKILKLYLEEIEKIDLTTISPKSVIRETVKAKIITEDEGDTCIEMVTNRNQTSHLYHEELANIIAQRIPNFYQLTHTITMRLQKKS